MGSAYKKKVVFNRWNEHLRVSCEYQPVIKKVLSKVDKEKISEEDAMKLMMRIFSSEITDKARKRASSDTTTVLWIQKSGESWSLEGIHRDLLPEWTRPVEANGDFGYSTANETISKACKKKKISGSRWSSVTDPMEIEKLKLKLDLEYKMRKERERGEKKGRLTASHY